MLIPKRSGRARVSCAGHELPSRGTLRGRPCEAGAPQVVEVDFGAPKALTGGLPGGVQRVPTEPPSFAFGYDVKKGPEGPFSR